jgi:hypothetical protein
MPADCRRHHGRPGSSTAPRRCVLLAIVALLVWASDAQAQDFSSFLESASPNRFSLELFATGYGSEKYGTAHQGVEIGQTLTQGISVVGRLSAYQIYQGTGFDSPLTPSAHSAVRDFGRFEGGLALTPIHGTTFTILAGEDVGDSDAAVFENNFSSWLWLQSSHPINASYSTSHFFGNEVTNGLVDLRTVAFSTGRLILLLGAGGAVWGGGTVGQAKGQGGPDVGLFMREWRLSIDVQAGYGSSKTYGMVSLSRSFGWDE